MAYRIEVYWDDGSKTYADKESYQDARKHAYFRLEDPECVAVKVINQMTGRLIFRKAKGAEGLRALGPVVPD